MPEQTMVRGNAASTASARRITMHGMLLQLPYWIGCCMYYSFVVTTLTDFGWSGSGATGVMTAMSVITMFVQPVYGYLCDKVLSEKKLSVILLILGAACFLLLPVSLSSGSMAAVLVNMIGITVTASQAGGLLDAWVVGLKQQYPSVNYGLIRGSGSLAFALAAQAAGMLTAAFGHSVRLWTGGCALIIAMLVTLTFRPAERFGGASAPSLKLSGGGTIKLIFSSKRYVLLLGAAFFLMLSDMVMMTVNQLLVPELGGSAAQIGAASAVMAGSEVPVMFLMGYMMRKVGFKKLLLFGGAAYVIRLFVTANVQTVSGLIAVQLLQGVTFAVLVPIMMSYLTSILDERIRSTAVTIYGACTASLTSIVGNLIITSLLASGHSIREALVILAFAAVIGFSLAVYGVVKKIW
ncbi:MAG: MFS transporter [Clostridia bacterium]|nr:MFS transporter [Clostridia bacterium]